jgi:hypothetical protein
MWFIVETMKINWTGSEKAHHKDHIGSLQTTPFCKYEQNNNTIPNNDMIYLRYTK